MLLNVGTEGDMTSVSIVIPCFQAHETIERCVRSLLSGDASGNLEIILESDDGTDYDWLCAKVPDVRSFSASHIASGPGPTRNRGLARAKGDWVTFVDSDDWVEPQYIAKMLATCRAEGAAVSQTNVLENGERIGSLGPTLAYLDLGEWAKTGMSMRGMFFRQRCPVFHDMPSQDIFQLVEAILQSDGGRIRMSDAVYNMVIRSRSVTTDSGFSDRVGLAYDDYIKIIKAQYGANAYATAAIDFFQSKKAINRSFETSAAASSFYRFLFDEVPSAAL